MENPQSKNRTENIAILSYNRFISDLKYVKNISKKWNSKPYSPLTTWIKILAHSIYWNIIK